METTFKVKMISMAGKFITYFEAENLADLASIDYDDEHFYIAYREEVTESGWTHELIGSWGNPIAYQRYLGVTKL